VEVSEAEAEEAGNYIFLVLSSWFLVVFFHCSHNAPFQNYRWSALSFATKRPKDFSFDEFRKLLKGFAYEETKTGKTSVSRVAFINYEIKSIIRMHRPHPNTELKRLKLCIK
jgi:hypothetical protein